MIKLPIAILTLLLVITAYAEIPIDKRQKINGVALTTGKLGSIRHYKSSHSRPLPHNVDLVLKAITNFSERCNNDLRSKRRFFEVEKNCRHHVEDVVETKLIKNLGGDRYLVALHLYRSGSYFHHELLEITTGKNEKGEKTYTIKSRMLTDPEVASFVQTDYKRDSDFTASTETYLLTATGPRETNVSYEYHAETDHWLLNKELSVPQVFAYIENRVTDHFRSVDEASSQRSREVASSK